MVDLPRFEVRPKIVGHWGGHSIPGRYGYSCTTVQLYRTKFSSLDSTSTAVDLLLTLVHCTVVLEYRVPEVLLVVY